MTSFDLVCPAVKFYKYIDNDLPKYNVNKMYSSISPKFKDQLKLHRNLSYNSFNVIIVDWSAPLHF